MSTSVSSGTDASRDSGPARGKPVVISGNDARQGAPGHELLYVLGFGTTGAIFAVAAVLAYFEAQVVGRRVSHRSAFVENVVALMVVTLALTVLMCLAAVAPAVWTFATAAAAETHIPVGLSQCLSVKGDPVHRISIRQAAPDCRCDVPANNRRNNWELTEWNDG